MPRPKGSKNKPQPVPYPMNLTTSERIELLASHIVDLIEDDIKAGSSLLKKIKAENKRTERTKNETGIIQ